MKKTLLFLQLVLITIFAFSQNVNIPDANFKAYLVGNNAINTNADTEIQITEATAFTGTISCNNLNIANLTGIEAFTNLGVLTVNNNNLTSINVTSNTSLSFLDVSDNNLSSLNVSNNNLLQQLRCENNTLVSLDLSGCPLLTLLYCWDNSLSNLNINNNTDLRFLNARNNSLSTLNVSINTLLEVLRCNNNNLTSIDITSNIKLEDVELQNNDLTALNIVNNILLEDLNCSYNNISILNTSTNSVLKDLYCSGNQITNLNLSQNNSLERLACDDNQLIGLNILNGNNTNINFFYSVSNPNLTCIQVDDVAYSIANWTDVDPASTFVNNQAACNALATESYELNNSFSVYPNPSQLYINIVYNKPIDVVEVYNILGEKVLETTAVAIPTDTLTNGVYFIKLYSGNKLGLKRFVKQ